MLLESSITSREVKIYRCDCSIIYRAIQCIEVAFFHLEIRVADFSPFEYPSVNVTFISFLSFVFRTSIWSESLAFSVKSLFATENRSSDAFKSRISSSVRYDWVLSAGIMFFCIFSSQSESYVVWFFFWWCCFWCS